MWLTEFVTFEIAAKKKKRYVFGSRKTSMICSRLRCLFSTPAWFTLIRSIATTFSSCDRKLAVAGESGKKNQKRMAVMNVITPVMIMSLDDIVYEPGQTKSAEVD